MRLTKQIMSAVVLMSLCGMLFLGLTNHPNDPPCVPKPYPVTMDVHKLPPELQPVFQKFVDDMNYRIIDEIYLRFCNYILDSIYEVAPCTVQHDHISGCVLDTLFIDHQGLELRDLSHGAPASLLLYEDSTADSNYASITVSREPDSLELEENYQLVLPKDDGNLHESHNIPNPLGTGGAFFASAWSNNKTANSELLTDGSGQLYWVDRDYFTRIMTDTIFADTTDTNGEIEIFAENTNFRPDTNTSRGAWQTNGTGTNQIRMYEGLPNGVNYYSLAACEDMSESVSSRFPTKTNEYYRSTLLGNDADDFVWGPYDNLFMLVGTDSALGTAGQDVVRFFHRAIRPSGVSFPYLTMESRLFRVELEWLRFDNDSTIGTQVSKSVAHGCPDIRGGDLRWWDLYLDDLSYFNGNNLILNNMASTTKESHDITTDTSFVVHLPTYGSDDTVLCYRWKVIGVIENWDGDASDCNSIP